MKNAEPAPISRIIRMRQLMLRIGLGRSTIYDRINKNSPRYDKDFPKPIKIGVSAVGWIESEVDEWINSVALKSRGNIN